MNEVEKFVDGLSNTEPEFDINQELHAGETPASEGEPQIPDAPKGEEGEGKELPYRHNPKIMKFVEKEVQRQLSKATPQGAEHIVIDRNTEAPEEPPYEWLAMYGDNEDSRKAWTHQSKLLEGYVTRAKQEALQEFQKGRDAEAREVQDAESYIEDSLENIEEEYGADFTSNTPDARKARSEFLDLVQRLSPKDADGNVTAFADFHEVYGIYKEASKPAVNPTITRQKDLAARNAPKNSEAPVTQKGYEAGMGGDGVRRAIGLD